MRACASTAKSCPTVLAKGEDFILYAILDFIVDNYMPVLETIQDEVDAIEDRVLRKPLTGADIERLYMLRRDLLRLRNAAAPLVEVCRRLRARRAAADRARRCSRCSATSPTTSARVQEKIDNLREVLAFAFEASLHGRPEPADGDRQAAGAWAAILAVPTAVAGIYGMNFEHMPELKWQYGYFIVVGMIGVVWLLSTSASAATSGCEPATRAWLAREGVPGRRLAEALDQEIDEHARLGGEIAVGRIERVDAELGRRGLRQHDRKPPRRDVGADEEGRQVGDAVAGERRRAQHLAVVGAQARA